jgi:hypothetical protein
MAERIAKAAQSAGDTEWKEDKGTWTIVSNPQPNAQELQPE